MHAVNYVCELHPALKLNVPIWCPNQGGKFLTALFAYKHMIYFLIWTHGEGGGVWEAWTK